jgi:hypothetical protein
MRTSKAGLKVLLAVVCGNLIVNAADAQSFSEIKGDRLNITDQRGVSRVSVGLSGGNQEFTYLRLLDNRGRRRIEFIVNSDSRAPTLTFYDSNGAEIQTAAGGSGRRPTFERVRASLPDEKTDSVQKFQPPVNGVDERRHLAAHNSGLFAIVRSQFAPQDMNKFTAAERERCSGNIYCQLDYRRRAISALLSP